MSDEPTVKLPEGLRPGDGVYCTKLDAETGETLEAWSVVAPDGSLYGWVGDFTPNVSLP